MNVSNLPPLSRKSPLSSRASGLFAAVQCQQKQLREFRPPFGSASDTSRKGKCLSRSSL